MLIYDFEVFKYDWLVVFKNTSTNEYTRIVNSVEKLTKFYTENKQQLYVGYNNKSYDNKIYKILMQDGDPYEVTQLLFDRNRKHLIYQLFEMYRDSIYSLDVMQDIMGMSLKEAQGFMQMEMIESSVPFDIDRKLTEEEIEEVFMYCTHDVDATYELLKIRAGYMKAKLNLINMFGLSKYTIDKTNAQLGAEILCAKRVHGRTDEMTYDVPKELLLDKYKYVEEFYTLPDEFDYDDKLVTDIFGVEHTFGWGGIHGAEKNFIYRGRLILLDADSHYPTMLDKYKYLSRNATKPERYKESKTDRLEAKATSKLLDILPSVKKLAKEKSDALKLFLNVCFGASKDKYNNLYDPKMGNATCISGQLFMLDFIEKIEPYIDKLVQSNTDGVIVIPKVGMDARLYNEIRKFEKRTGLTMAMTEASGIWQKDVNNYILLAADGSITTKGEAVTQYEKSNFNIRNTGRIIDIGVVNYFVYGKSPEETVNLETDKYLFQLIKKRGPSFEKTIWDTPDGEKVVNKTNRIYSTIDKRYGKVYKWKMAEVCTYTYEYIEVDGKKKRKRTAHPTGEMIEKRHSLATIPNHCYVDNENKFDIKNLDRQFYIDVIYSKIKQFKGVKK